MPENRTVEPISGQAYHKSAEKESSPIPGASQHVYTDVAVAKL